MGGGGGQELRLKPACRGELERLAKGAAAANPPEQGGEWQPRCVLPRGKRPGGRGRGEAERDQGAGAPPPPPPLASCFAGSALRTLPTGGGGLAHLPVQGCVWRNCTSGLPGSLGLQCRLRMAGEVRPRPLSWVPRGLHLDRLGKEGSLGVVTSHHGRGQVEPLPKGQVNTDALS